MTEYARLVLSVDSSEAKRSSSDLDRLESAGRSTERGMQRLEQQTRRNTQAAGQMNVAMSALKGAILGAISVSALQSVAGMVQGYQEMAERVRMATSGVAEFELVQRRLLDTADGTYRSLAEAQELYIRTADSLRSMGYSTEQALDVTDSMSYAFVTNAASADRASAAISAFSKSMNTGKVAADNWESITSAIPSIINAIADASGRSSAEVRALGSAGKLTARDLSEGLRKSLDDNAKAAAEMAATMKDAGERAKNAMTALFVAIEDRTGAIQGVTNAIVSTSKAIRDFTDDTAAVNDTLKTLGTVAEYAGALIAARLVTAVTAYSLSQGQAVIATLSRIKAEQAAAQASLASANADRAKAISALATAKAEFEAAAGTNAHAFAQRNLAAAQAVAMQAAVTQRAAQHAVNSAMTVGTVAARGFAGAMALLGGPAGVILMAASAIGIYALSANDAEQPTIDLTTAVKDLTAAQRELAQFEAKRKLEELGETAKKVAADVEAANALMARADVKGAQTDRFKEALAGRKVELEQINAEIKTYEQRLKDLANVPVPATDKPAAAPVEPATSTEGQRGLARMREQVELAKLQGEARAKLAAIQSLGAKATEQERLEAAKLAAEIYRLEEAQSAAADSAKEQAKQAEKNAEASARLAEEIESYVTGLERQAALAGKSASAVREYEIAERGLTGAMLERAEAAGKIIDAVEAETEARRKLEQVNGEARNIMDALMTDEEAIRASYARRREIILSSTEGTQQERAQAMLRLEAETNEQLLEINGSYWERWLSAAENSLTDFDELAGNVIKNFGDQFGEAFEAMIFDSQSLGEAIDNLAEGMARSIVNALGQMAAQWLAYQAVQLLVGKTTQSSAATAMAATANATSIQAGLNAFSSTAAIPVTGPAMAPAAMAAAIAATAPMAAAVSSLALAGMAHDGIDSIPREGTWLLDKGERVVDNRTNQDLKRYLSEKNASNEGAGTGAPMYITVNQPNVTNAREAKSASMQSRRELGRAIAGTQRAM